MLKLYLNKDISVIRKPKYSSEALFEALSKKIMEEQRVGKHVIGMILEKRKNGTNAFADK